MSRQFAVEHSLTFDPWPVSRVREMVSKYRSCHADGTLEERREEFEDFEKHHPMLCKMLKETDPSKARLVDQIIETRARRERGDISEHEAIDKVTSDVLGRGR